jgi:hypothetical protein
LEQISRRSSILKFQEEIRNSCHQDEEMEVSVVEVEDEEEDGDEAPENDLTKQIREEHTSIILKLDGSINEKEKLLAAIKESQTQMQNDLISLMKN